MYIYLFPFGFQYTFITLPQLGHFSDTIIQPEPVSPMSQARFLHHLSGHFIFRIIPPPLPQNTSVAISPHWYVTREPACLCQFPFIVCSLCILLMPSHQIRPALPSRNLSPALPQPLSLSQKTEKAQCVQYILPILNMIKYILLSPLTLDNAL